MDKRIIKSALVFLIASIYGLIMPAIGEWYYIKTGLHPYALWIIGIIGTTFMIIASLMKIWGEIE